MFLVELAGCETLVGIKRLTVTDPVHEVSIWSLTLNNSSSQKNSFGFGVFYGLYGSPSSPSSVKMLLHLTDWVVTSLQTQAVK